MAPPFVLAPAVWFDAVMQSDNWQPGDLVRLDSPELSLRSLRQSDLTGDVERIVGSEARTEFVWKPKLSGRDYLNGLIGRCDQEQYFLFGIFIQESGELIGYRKAQIVEEFGELVVIPTMVVGDEWAGRGLGQRSGPLHHWFFMTQLGVGGIHPRIYEANRAIWQLAERHGYELQSRSNASMPDGSVKKVRVYRLSAQKMQAEVDTSLFRMSKLV